jgi:hypothetical protein
MCIDLFTFMQKLPETSPKDPCPMECGYMAVLPVSTSDHWWTDQIGCKARNKAGQAEKKGSGVRQLHIADVLVLGTWGLTVPPQGNGTRT